MHFPVVWQIGPVTLSAHVVFEVLAYSLGFQLYRRLQQQQSQPLRLSSEQKRMLLLGCVLGAIALAKGLGWLQTPFILSPEGERVWLPPGKTIVGGLLGGWLGLELSKHWLGLRGSTGDAYVWPLSLGLALGRVGCFLTGLADNTYGLPTSLPWGIDFGDGLLRHPTQLYEILWVLLLAPLVLWLSRHSAPGTAFRCWLAGYLLWRFAAESLKPVPLLYGGLSAIHWASLLGCAMALYSAWQLKRALEPVASATDL